MLSICLCSVLGLSFCCFEAACSWFRMSRRCFEALCRCFEALCRRFGALSRCLRNARRHVEIYATAFRKTASIPSLAPPVPLRWLPTPLILLCAGARKKMLSAFDYFGIGCHKPDCRMRIYSRRHRVRSPLWRQKLFRFESLEVGLADPNLRLQKHPFKYSHPSKRGIFLSVCKVKAKFWDMQVCWLENINPNTHSQITNHTAQASTFTISQTYELLSTFT